MKPKIFEDKQRISAAKENILAIQEFLDQEIAKLSNGKKKPIDSDKKCASIMFIEQESANSSATAGVFPVGISLYFLY